jgi:hypothetical protein
MREADAGICVSPVTCQYCQLPTANYQRAYHLRGALCCERAMPGHKEKQGNIISSALGWEMQVSTAGIASAMLRN